jgi:signal transduction histidine kinase
MHYDPCALLHGVLFANLEDGRLRFPRVVTGFIEARDVAEAASRSKGEFLANTSHELRTPLNAIVGMTGLLRDSRLDAQQRGWLVRIDEAAKLLLGLIDDLLDQAKIEAGKIVLSKRPFSLVAALQEAVGMVRPDRKSVV